MQTLSPRPLYSPPSNPTPPLYYLPSRLLSTAVRLASRLTPPLSFHNPLQAPVITQILILAETVGTDPSLLNAPPPPAVTPPDYTAGR